MLAAARGEFVRQPIAQAIAVFVAIDGDFVPVCDAMQPQLEFEIDAAKIRSSEISVSLRLINSSRILSPRRRSKTDQAWLSFRSAGDPGRGHGNPGPGGVGRHDRGSAGQELITAGPRSPTPGAPFTYVTAKGFLEYSNLDTLRDLQSVDAR